MQTTLLLNKVEKAAQLCLKEESPAGPLMQLTQQGRLEQTLAGVLQYRSLAQVAAVALAGRTAVSCQCSC